ncbi:MAG: tetratricopeptide repeat protein, partial [Treponema sp.]|nr:tetratricopeptide repeat protein [Treponema sp.]
MSFQEERNWWAASERFQEALKENPSYADAWYRLAQCVYEMDSPETALEYLQNAKKFAPGRSDILNLEGMALLSLGRLDEAKKIFEDVQKKYPNDIEARFGLAELNLFGGRVSGAERLYSDALKINPGNVKALLSLALISQELGKDSLAERFINQAEQGHADNPQVYYIASYLALKKGDVSLAEKKCLSAIQVSPDYFEAYELLALVYYKQGRYEEVIDLADWSLSRDRNKGNSWYIKGLAQSKLNQIEKAITTWGLGLEAVPEDEAMRAAFELLASQWVDLEDSRRAEWAKYHIQKAEDYSKKYAGPQMRYEYQAALRLEPTNYKARAAFSKLLKGQGFSENYLAQIKFIQDNDILKEGIEKYKSEGKNLSEDESKAAFVKLSDTVEGYESFLENTLASKWNVNPFYLDKSRWTIGLYYLPSNEILLHPDLEKLSCEHLSVLFRGVLGTNVTAIPKAASSFGQAYADSRKNGYDYFILLSAAENERDINLVASMNSSRTGTLTQNFSVYKTGNNKYVNALLSLRQGILDVLPVRA